MGYALAKLTYDSNEEWRELQHGARMMDNFGQMGAMAASLMFMAFGSSLGPWGTMIGSGLAAGIGRGIALDIFEELPGMDQSEGLFWQTARDQYEETFDPWGETTQQLALGTMLQSGMDLLGSTITDSFWDARHQKRIDKGKKIWFPGQSDVGKQWKIDTPKITLPDKGSWDQDVLDLDAMLDADLMNQPGYPDFASPPLEDFDEWVGKPMSSEQIILEDLPTKGTSGLDTLLHTQLTGGPGQSDTPLGVPEDWEAPPIKIDNPNLTKKQNKQVNTILGAMQENTRQKEAIMKLYNTGDFLKTKMDWTTDIGGKPYKELPTGKLFGEWSPFDDWSPFEEWRPFDDWSLKGGGPRKRKDIEKEIVEKKEPPLMEIPETPTGSDFNWVTEIGGNEKELPESSIDWHPFNNEKRSWKPFDREWREKNKRFLYKDFKPGWFETKETAGVQKAEGVAFNMDKYGPKDTPNWYQKRVGRKKESIKKTTSKGDPVEYQDFHLTQKTITDDSKPFFQRKKKYVAGAGKKELDYMESNLPEYSQKGLPSIGDGFSYEDLDYGFVNVPGYKSKTALGSGADMMPIEKINPLTGDRFSYNPTKGIWEFTAHSKKRKFLPNVFGEWK